MKKRFSTLPTTPIVVLELVMLSPFIVIRSFTFRPRGTKKGSVRNMVKWELEREVRLRILERKVEEPAESFVKFPTDSTLSKFVP